jgi:hypothetical protein
VLVGSTLDSSDSCEEFSSDAVTSALIWLQEANCDIGVSRSVEKEKVVVGSGLSGAEVVLGVGVGTGAGGLGSLGTGVVGNGLSGTGVVGNGLSGTGTGVGVGVGVEVGVGVGSDCISPFA